MWQKSNTETVKSQFLKKEIFGIDMGGNLWTCPDTEILCQRTMPHTGNPFLFRVIIIARQMIEKECFSLAARRALIRAIVNICKPPEISGNKHTSSRAKRQPGTRFR